jgi:hypothetical protein
LCHDFVHHNLVTWEAWRRINHSRWGVLPGLKRQIEKYNNERTKNYSILRGLEDGIVIK